MKAVAAVSLALIGSVLAAGGADTVNQVLSQIASDLKEFDSAIKSYSGGDASALTASSKKIEQTTNSGASQIAAGPELSLTDAVGITSNVQSLQNTLDGALSDLKSIAEKLAASGNCPTILGELQSQVKGAQALQDAITSKAPAETKAVAQQLGGAIGAALEDTNAYFKKTCANAPSGGPSGGAGGAGGHADMPGMPGMGGSPSGAGGPPKGGSGSDSAGSKTNKGTGSKTSSVPKPAQYTGAAAALTAPMAGALALAFFAL